MDDTYLESSPPENIPPSIFLIYNAIPTMRIILLGMFCLLISSVSIQAQNKNKRSKSGDSSGLILSQIGKSLYDYELAATSTDSLGSYEWRFILAEYGLRSQVSKGIAKDLTSFLFTFNPNSNRYNGKVLRTKEGLDEQRVLAMIYQQLRQNLRQYGSNVDFVRIDNQYFYVLYFPYDKS